MRSISICGASLLWLCCLSFVAAVPTSDLNGARETGVQRRNMAHSAVEKSRDSISQVMRQDDYDDHDHDHDHDHGHGNEGDCNTTCRNWKIGFIFFTLLAGLIGGALPPILKNTLATRKVIEGLVMFSGGVLFSLALLDLLPHALEELGPQELLWEEYPYALTMVMVGFLLNYFVEFVGGGFLESVAVKKHEGLVADDEKNGIGSQDTTGVYMMKTVEMEVEDSSISPELVEWKDKSLPPQETKSKADAVNLEQIQIFIASGAAYVGLSLHAILAGISLGIGSWESALGFFIAIISHKSFASFAAASEMLKGEPKMLTYWLVVIGFACVTPISIAVGLGLSEFSNTIATGTIQALSAGMLLYVGTVHTFNHSGAAQKEMARWAIFLYYLTGAALMTIVAVILAFATEGHGH